VRLVPPSSPEQSKSKVFNKPSLKIIFGSVLITLVFVAGYFWRVEKSAAPAISEQGATSTEYRNTQYGFSITLPKSWKGYSIVTTEWNGFAVGAEGNVPFAQGPLISIRHPLWTKEVPRQDIPVMVFTLAEWNSLAKEEFHIGAAPIGPSELGRNAEYVFALPARYNFAFPIGFEEVDQIIQGKPLHAF